MYLLPFESVVDSTLRQESLPVSKIVFVFVILVNYEAKLCPPKDSASSPPNGAYANQKFNGLIEIHEDIRCYYQSGHLEWERGTTIVKG